MKAISVRFHGSDRTYDYLCPFDVSVGTRVVVGTRRGEATVEVVEVKEHSEVATAEVLRVAEAQF